MEKRYVGVRGIIQREINKLLESEVSIEDLLFKLAGFYGSIMSIEEVKQIYKK